MKESFDKIVEWLEREYDYNDKKKKEAYEEKDWEAFDIFTNRNEGIYAALAIVKQVAEEYAKTQLTADNSTCNSICSSSEIPNKSDGWIPVSERLPEDGDCRFYMCIVENHEEDLPMFCQFEEEYGFGFWHDIYDGHTLGFVDSEFRTNEELGYEKVIAWQPLPAPFKPKGEQ